MLSNHDVARHPSRYARDQQAVSGHGLDALLDLPADPGLGERRARAAVLLMLALPGSVYLYQGEELGLPEVEDLPPDVLADPTWRRTEGAVRGRDGCRVPMPWFGDAPPFGFSAGVDAQPWLPQPPAWRDRTVAAQHEDPASMLSLYVAALQLRREHPSLGAGGLTWLDAGPEALLFARGPDVRCAVNFGADPMPLPDHLDVLCASGPLDGGRLPSDTAVWLRTAE